MEVIHAIGRRKRSIARIYINNKGKGKIEIFNNNNKSTNNQYIKYNAYFTHAFLIQKLLKPFTLTNTLNKYDTLIKVYGGGKSGQVDAIVLAISRCLCKINPDYKGILKSYNFLTRDPREVERKKFGQKKARKRFQFSKR